MEFFFLCFYLNYYYVFASLKIKCTGFIFFSLSLFLPTPLPIAALSHLVLLQCKPREAALSEFGESACVRLSCYKSTACCCSKQSGLKPEPFVHIPTHTDTRRRGRTASPFNTQP
ncbi:hypothetical protein ATANTOWER_002286 [Ataeniobius toweri]|uniref:Secreted protein n=1 Tax=Ataeniobius toweri TaxID=208326 RepID=A0ABU7A3W4_9TELE|nr:hypothetical protein [Ataeniobius toweri]